MKWFPFFKGCLDLIFGSVIIFIIFGVWRSNLQVFTSSSEISWIRNADCHIPSALIDVLACSCFCNSGAKIVWNIGQQIDVVRSFLKKLRISTCFVGWNLIASDLRFQIVFVYSVLIWHLIARKQTSSTFEGESTETCNFRTIYQGSIAIHTRICPLIKIRKAPIFCGVWKVKKTWLLGW